MGRFERMWLYVIPLMVVAVFFAWFFRFEVRADGANSYRLDRWSGKIQRCYVGSCGEWY
jgi:hypothetical protein